MRMVGDDGATRVKSSPKKGLKDPSKDSRTLGEGHDQCPEWAAWQVSSKR